MHNICPGFEHKSTFISCITCNFCSFFVKAVIITLHESGVGVIDVFSSVQLKEVYQYQIISEDLIAPSW